VIPEVAAERIAEVSGLAYLLHKSESLAPGDLPHLEEPVEAAWYRCAGGECWYIFPVLVEAAEAEVGRLFKRRIRRLRVRRAYPPADPSQLPQGVPHVERVGDVLDGEWYAVHADPDEVGEVEVKGRWLFLDLPRGRVGIKMPCEARRIYMCKDDESNPFSCPRVLYVEC